MGAREDVLGRISSALRDVPPEETSESFPVPRDYRRQREHPEGDVERFGERVADYKATVEQVRPDEVGAAVDALKLAGASWDVLQLQASRSKPILHMHRMAAENPVWIVCAQAKESA